jgi:hypothetical protein
MENISAARAMFLTEEEKLMGRPGDLFECIRKAQEHLSYIPRVGVIDGLRLISETQRKDWKPAQAE